MHVSRFSISIEKELLEKLDELTHTYHFSNRSRTVRYLIQQATIEKKRKENKVVSGAIILQYSHQQRELQAQSTHLQHHHHDLILSVQHVHLDHDECLETLAVKGKANELEQLAKQLISMKGISYGTLVITGNS